MCTECLCSRLHCNCYLQESALVQRATNVQLILISSFFALQERERGKEKEIERENRASIEWTIVLTAFLTNDECASEAQEAASFCFLYLIHVVLLTAPTVSLSLQPATFNWLAPVVGCNMS